MAPEPAAEFELKEKGCGERSGSLKTYHEVRHSEISLILGRWRGIGVKGDLKVSGTIQVEHLRWSMQAVVYKNRVVRRH